MGKKPEFSNWKDEWDWHAGQSRMAFDRESEDALLKRIQARQYGDYHTIWYALREKGTLAKCAPVLLNVLRREVGEDNMLTRYHCAAALFHLLGEPDDPIPELRKRVQWTYQGEEKRQQAIDELEVLVQQRLTQAK